MKANSNRNRARIRLLRQKLKSWVCKKPRLNLNRVMKREQLRHAGVLLLILLGSFGFYRLQSQKHAIPEAQEEMTFDGVFDTSFNKDSDEALIEKQQQELNALKNTVEATAKSQMEAQKEGALDADTKALIAGMQEKLARLESDNQKTSEQLQVALAMNAQGRPGSQSLRPPTREEQEARRLERQRTERDLFRNAGLETVHFNSRQKRVDEVRTHHNYVWAGTFVEGVLLTGILGDAGINGSKNMGTAMIRLTSRGIMPNEQQSHLEGCFALVSTYGDLSGSSVVLHLETLSCAGKNINFEQKAYGSVFDLDAMQDLRGTPVLKTKPLLGYSAAASIIAGFGNGLSSYGTAQTTFPNNGAFTTYASPSSMAINAAGGAVSNPANRLADYVMKIADIYHPLVVARAGRRVSVLFTKGFWIDKEHQVYESGKAIDEGNSSKDSGVTRTVSDAGGIDTEPVAEGGFDAETQSETRDNTRSLNTQGANEYMESQKPSSLPLFSTVQKGEIHHE